MLRLPDAVGSLPVAGEGLTVARRTSRIGLAALCAGVVVVVVVATLHPVASGTGTSAPLIRIRAVGQHAGTASTNWSGYGIAGSFVSVTGRWTVPAVSPTTGATYSSTWLGIDGLANRNLIQTGTDSDYVGGQAHYDAWWEILPATERVIGSLVVRPGDTMTASVGHLSRRRWEIVIRDVSTGGSFSIVHGYRGPAASAEWIEERPQIGRSLASLAHYGTTTFWGLTVNGVDPRLTGSEAISMVGTGGTPTLSTPAGPSPRGDAFTVAFGALVPAAPPG